MKLERHYSIGSLRQEARRRLPSGVFHFVDGAAEDEVTARRNETSLAALQLLPRALAGTTARGQQLQLFGRPIAHPMLIAPTGSAGLLWPQGEIAAARAIMASGSIYVASHASTVSLEALARATDGRRWFQSFVFRDPSLTDRMMERALAADYEALVINVDTQVPSKRERDLRNGFTSPPRWTPGTVASYALRPGWAWRLARGGRIGMANYEEIGFASLLKAGQRIPTLVDPAASWIDIRRIRDRWKRKLVIKGLLDPAEVARACEEGVDAVVVSNHGGRQLDGAVASIDVLSAAVSAAAGRLPVLLDGGIRRGSDVLKVRALGGTAVLLGRAHLWGLAVAGEAGVARAIAILRAELDQAMAMTGCDGVESIGPDIIWHGATLSKP
ncbi:alpha-hydroxy-acid oxidizing protein [soil metagenome]